MTDIHKYPANKYNSNCSNSHLENKGACFLYFLSTKPIKTPKTTSLIIFYQMEIKIRRMELSDLIKQLFKSQANGGDTFRDCYME